MRYVLFCGKRLPALIAVATLFFTFSAGQALAARTAAGASPIDSTTPVNWAGAVEGSVGGPSECDDDFTSLPPFISTAVCSSYFLEALETGVIEVVVAPTTPEPDPTLAPDLNLFVFACDAPIERPSLSTAPASPQAGCLTPVALSTTGPAPGQSNEGSGEQVTFPAVAGVAYEVVTVPGFAFVPVAYNGCAAYNDACVDLAPTEVPGEVPAAQFLTACAADATASSRRHVTGGGYFLAPNDKKQHFSTHVNKKDGNLKGVLNFKDEPTDSRYFSKHITCASFNDVDKTVDYRGTATKKIKGSNGKWQEASYCFTAHAKDGGKQGGPVDELELAFFPLDTSAETCDTSELGAERFGGSLYKGQIRYHRTSDDERNRADD